MVANFSISQELLLSVHLKEQKTLFNCKKGQKSPELRPKFGGTSRVLETFMVFDSIEVLSG